MTIASGGGIWQGTGSFASPTTGLKIYNSSGVGRLSTYNAGLEQITINTAGQLVAGAGKVVIDRSGMVISPLSGSTAPALRLAPGSSDSTYGYLDGDSSSVTIGLKGTTVLNGPRMSVTRDGLWLNHVGGFPSTLYVTNGAIVADFENGGVLSVNDRLGVTNDIAAGGGLVIGDTTLDPLTGVLLMKERTSATTPTPADTAQIWVQDVSGTQKFYIKFANGVQRELATA